MRVRKAVTPVLVAATILAGAGVPAAQAQSTANAAAAVSQQGRWLVDSQGRAEVLHGVNIITKVAPGYPERFGAADAQFLADEGFTTARIGFIWSFAEPQPGVYDDAYIDHILDLNALLASHGIHTLIDVHQDLWGGGLVLGDGAPTWASLGSTIGQDFEAFWNDEPGPGGVGIQTRFVDLWTHLASRIGASPAAGNLLGIDPFNEPQAGDGYSSCSLFQPCPAFEQTQLHQFYERLIAAVRDAGYGGVVFPEGVPGSDSQVPALPAFADAQVAVNAHYYCAASQFLPDLIGLISVPYCKNPDETAFDNLDAYGAQLNAASVVSEFGANDADAEYAHQVDLMGSRFLSWMYWMYYSSPLEPGNFLTQGLLRNDLQPGSEQNAKALKLDALAVPYAQAIAGTPQSSAFDRTSKVMTLTYATQAVPGATLDPSAATRIFVPQRDYPAGYTVNVTGAQVTSPAGSTQLELVNDPQAQQVTVTISPA
jgi:endoglycosylceramidase